MKDYISSGALKRAHPRIILAASVLAVFYIILQKAWVTEDAYISFRVVDNFVNGYGLRWNVDERVQVFTNPLWMLLHIPFYYFSNDIFNTTIALSLVISISAFFLLVRQFLHRPSIIVFIITIPCALSRAFTDWSTSGLENPLIYLCLVSFFIIFFRDQKRPQWFLLSAVAGISAFTRLDSIIFYVPAFVLLGLLHWRSIEWKKIAIGFSPVIIWFAFSLFYYGYIFPTTKYGKMDSGFPLSDYIRNGIYSIADFVTNDFMSAILITIIGVVAIVSSAQFIRARGENIGKIAAASLGVAIYIIYFLYAGGDYMSGRLQSTPFFLSVIILSYLVSGLSPEGRQNIIAISLGIFFVAIFFLGQTIEDPRKIRDHQILDQRRLFISWCFICKDRVDIIRNEWSVEGFKQKSLAKKIKDKKKARYVTRFGSVGVMGYYAGPQVTVLSYFGLIDPLIARLPSTRKTFRIGHLGRALPMGYDHFRRTGSYKRMHPDIVSYYKPLRYIISGSLFEWDRIKKIAAFNFGQYDNILEKYIKTYKKRYPPIDK